MNTRAVEEAVLDALRGGLIVSCQAEEGGPLDHPEILAAFAQCAVSAGAVGIRANHGRNIAAITQAVSVPVIGIKKRQVPPWPVYITPEFDDAREVVQAGAAIVAADATRRPRPVPFPVLVEAIHRDLGALVMADCATLDEGLAAADAGADLVATTMSGYTEDTAHRKVGPDLGLVEALAQRVNCPVICEGRVHRPEEARAALEAGAFAVVVGTAITSPAWIARQFVEALAAGRHSP
ncbi:MAG: N-acetylmannosamine-6-phosphate 2-epimerase [Chthonomonadales bacterium]